jgi:hypothetical protein
MWKRAMEDKRNLVSYEGSHFRIGKDTPRTICEQRRRLFNPHGLVHVLQQTIRSLRYGTGKKTLTSFLYHFLCIRYAVKPYFVQEEI